MQNDDDEAPELEDAPAEREQNRGPLHGVMVGPPFAIASDCGLVPRDDTKKVPGCCACLSCDGCGQLFRIDLLSSKGMHACPKCRAEYTSVLIVAASDDPTILQHALDTVLASNGLRAQNPDDDDDEGDDEGDDDEGDDLDGEQDLDDQVDDQVEGDDTPR
jgi:hypothetical protein